MAQANSSVQAHKNQAERLAQYLETIGRSVTRTQSLEALSRALHGKPWNTARAELKTPATPAVEPGSSGPRETYLHYADLSGQPVMFSVVGEFRRGSLSMSSNLNAGLFTLSDEQLVSAFEDDAAGWPTVYAALEAVHGPFYRGGSASDTRLSFATTFGDGFGTWLKAFRPQLYWCYLACRLFGSLEAASSTEFGRCEVAQDVDQPGLWVYFFAGEGCDSSYDSELDAQLALCARVERDAALCARFEPLHKLAEVRAGSGMVERGGITPVFAGRHDASTGRTLFLRGPALDARQLDLITNEGEFSIDIAVPVSIWDMASNDVDWLNDHVSELITGSICDLESLDFTRGVPGEQEPELAPTEVWVRVVAHWAPMND